MLVNLFSKQDEFKNIIGHFPQKKGVLSMGVEEDIWPFFISFIASFHPMPLLVITSTIDRARELEKELSLLTGKKIFSWPPAGSSAYYRNKAGDIMSISERLKAVKALKSGKKPVIVSGISACLNLMDKEKADRLNPLTLALGNTFNREKLGASLIKAGYERVNMVYDKGEFSIKGSLLDIYEVGSDFIARLDFFGDELESVYRISPVSRKILGKEEKVSIFPHINPWEPGRGKGVSLQQYIKESSGSLCLILCDPLEISIKLGSDREILQKILKQDIEKTVFENIEDARAYLIGEEEIEGSADIVFRLNTYAKGSRGKLWLKIGGQKKSFGKPETFISNIRKDFSAKRKVFIALPDTKRRKKVKQILTEEGISFREKEGEQKDRAANITGQKLLRGFESKDVSLYGELDIYEFPSRKLKEESLSSLKEIEDFKPGEYLVHKTHGIGRYVDIVSRQVNGYKRDYFLLEYAKGDKLYVPTWQSDRLARYIGRENPAITPLNSRQWDTMKKRVRKSVKKLAIDLSRLYAQREASEGFSFPKDSPWQREVADLFPFSETGDQTKAIGKVKRAMAVPKPMDMLLCGDVGFGKTEVAIRAAFRAIEAGKQVMMLVPTTILAGQHYRTFSERYNDYPVVLEVLSRFRKKSIQKEIISAFNEGKIDMVIGTHRILQKDIRPPNLGLIIIDEEQRFGVASKEKIKLLKKNADVLTLTATPIPRTLYMALTGIRDIATIQTHPEGRNPIETFVGNKDEDIIRQAVEREMARGGQVYYVFNRVQEIESKMRYLKSLVPRAGIAITHGQMRGAAIEQTMADFIGRKYDILLTTTIIESGMDIGNVNTLIVEDSHRFGLSQLYQLRGRVGRSTERAYSYFFYPKRKDLSITALRRLKALAEHTDLGSGYSIALRDMEIRGAGEILGPRQSGHMDSVGFDMYCQIMKEEVAKIKGQEIKPDLNIQIEIPVSSYIPKSFIPREYERINIYRNLGKAESIGEIDRIGEELVARHANLPRAVTNLINIARIKILMQKAFIASMVYSKEGIMFKKVDLGSRQQQKLGQIDQNLYYDAGGKAIVLKKLDKNIDLGLVYNILNAIIKSMDFKQERGN
ncbi:MAG: transcription-repair coupling factor [Actinomycetota bacterium]